MDPQQQFCLKWNSFGNNLVSTFDNLFKSASLTDVTLFCEGVTFKAHKLILAACSKHFQDLFESAPSCPSILVILDGTSSSNMSALLEFMYKGEVHVAQESLSSFLKAAEYLQVKGLSVEQEKLVTQQHSSDSRVDSPSSTRNSKQNKSTGGQNANKMEDGSGGGSRSGHGNDSESMLPPSSPASSSSYSPSAYPMYRNRDHYDQRLQVSSHALSYEVLPSRKRHPPRSPNDSMRDSHIRGSVLRDGSKLDRESPLQVGFTPPPSSSVSHHYEPLPPTIPPPLSVDGTAAAGSFERSGNIEKSPSPQHWHSNSNCAEDLRIKCEENAGSGIDENGGDRKYYSGSLESNQRDREVNDRIPPPPALEIVQSPSGSRSNTWNSALPNPKMDPPHKGVTTTTTPDGKKLQCPFCERLYGYETNLRAHIRQRHQGIRVPCPFCSRTFTRNNTVRRHIAREHKTELSLKALQQGQVQNHNQ